jgi:hypothetical protein
MPLPPTQIHHERKRGMRKMEKKERKREKERERKRERVCDEMTITSVMCV